jgi:hypothetical protein
MFNAIYILTATTRVWQTLGFRLELTVTCQQSNKAVPAWVKEGRKLESIPITVCQT